MASGRRYSYSRPSQIVKRGEERVRRNAEQAQLDRRRRVLLAMREAERRKQEAKR